MTEFLRNGAPPLDLIIRFITLDTLYEFSATASFFNTLHSDGSVHIPAWFGCSVEDKNLIPLTKVTSDSPVNEALRTGTIVECGNFEEFRFSGPNHAVKVFPNGFASSFAFPIPSFGVIATFCEKKMTIDSTIAMYLRAVGGILAMQLSQGPYKSQFRSQNRAQYSAESLALTPRQWIILAGLRRGDTNARIAKELKVSESLVRQETVRIYRSLNVSGRKDLFEAQATAI